MNISNIPLEALEYLTLKEIVSSKNITFLENDNSHDYRAIGPAKNLVRPTYIWVKIKFVPINFFCP